jgi:hypothetical protein
MAHDALTALPISFNSFVEVVLLATSCYIYFLSAASSS